MALTTLHCLFGIREIQVRAKHALLIATFVIPIIAAACSNHGSSPSQVAPSAAIVSPTDDSPRGDPRPADPPENPACTFVEQGYGPKGTTRVRAETVVTGLDVPWSLTFLPDGDMLVTERPGRIRLVHNGVLVRDPVATVPVARDEEGGLLGLALDPDVAKTHRFFIYRTTDEGGQRSNRVERWHLADDARTAQFERVIVDRIAASPYHNGGRLRIGPDRMLYIGTGDARHPDSSQDPDSINGKILRVALDGAPAPNNPWPNRRAYITGLRNVEAFDWVDERTLVIADHGPSGEFGQTGQDEVDIARAGDNLGWPKIHGCGTGDGMVTPVLSWRDAAPPGGGMYYTSEVIPAWRGSFLVATLRAKHLHRVAIDRATHRVSAHEVYFAGDPPSGLGRLREIVVGPDQQLYVTTSNCDGRGVCPDDKDRIVRIRSD